MRNIYSSVWEFELNQGINKTTFVMENVPATGTWLAYGGWEERDVAEYIKLGKHPSLVSFIAHLLGMMSWDFLNLSAHLKNIRASQLGGFASWCQGLNTVEVHWAVWMHLNIQRGFLAAVVKSLKLCLQELCLCRKMKQHVKTCS